MQAPDRVALVTGASSGIGRAAAIALARAGHAVAVVARRGDRLREAAAEITRAGAIAEVLVADLTAPGAPGEVLRRTEQRFSRLDVLVNNAGWGYCSPVDRMPEEAVRRMLELNLVAPFLLVREALPLMRRTGGVIINVSSGAGLLPTPFYAAYGATKAALVSLSDSVRIEERLRADGVRAVTICPGPVRTEFGEAAGGAPVHADRLGVRIQSAEEIAALIVRQTRRAGRTVATSGAVRAGSLLARLAPPLFDRLVLRWARRVKPDIERWLAERKEKDSAR